MSREFRSCMFFSAMSITVSSSSLLTQSSSWTWSVGCKKGRYFWRICMSSSSAEMARERCLGCSEEPATVTVIGAAPAPAPAAVPLVRSPLLLLCSTAGCTTAECAILKDERTILGAAAGGLRSHRDRPKSKSMRGRRRRAELAAGEKQSALSWLLPALSWGRALINGDVLFATCHRVVLIGGLSHAAQTFTPPCTPLTCVSQTAPFLPECLVLSYLILSGRAFLCRQQTC